MRAEVKDVKSRKFIEKCMGTSQKIMKQAINYKSELPETSVPGDIKFCMSEDVAYIFQDNTWWCMGRLRRTDKATLLLAMHSPDWDSDRLDNYSKGLLKEILNDVN